jgi:hypothetical protein
MPVSSRRYPELLLSRGCPQLNVSESLDQGFLSHYSAEATNALLWCIGALLGWGSGLVAHYITGVATALVQSLSKGPVLRFPR